MRVLYVGGYQGTGAVAQRRLKRNRALGASTKMEAIAGALAIRGHAVHILSDACPAERTGRLYGPLPDSIRVSGKTEVPVHYLPSWDVPFFNVRTPRLPALRWIHRQDPFDAAIVYNLGPNSLPLIRYLKRAFDIPVVLEYEDDATATLNGTSAFHRMMGSRAIHSVRRLVDGALVVCPELAAQLNVENVEVIYGVVALDIAEITRFPVHADQPRDHTIVYTGGLTWPKGPDLLLEAMGLLPESVSVDIIGAGPLQTSLGCAAATLAPRVRVHGEVDRKAMVRLIAGASIAANPHRVGKGQVGTLFPFKLLEYLGSGVPVVSSRVGVIPEAVRNHVTWYTDDTPEALSAALSEVLQDYHDKFVGAQRARKWALATHSVEAIGSRVESVLRRAGAS